MRFHPLLRLALATCLIPSSIALSQGISGIEWEDGPSTSAIGLIAKVDIPNGCRYTAKAGARKFMIATENPPSGSEEGVLLCGDTTFGYWFVVFSFEESGLVKDDEGKALDAAKLLKTLRAGNAEGNKVRKDKGWATLEIAGWLREPYYDPQTNNLTWSTRIRASDDTGETVNHSVRLLGRRGVMNADLVAGTEIIEGATAAFDSVVASYEFLPGSKYAEWKEGDAVARYGLTALIAGGAGVAGAKLGLFGKAWKLILAVLLALKKAVIVVVVAIAGLFKKIFGGSKAKEDSTGVSAPASAYKAPAPAASSKAGASSGPPPSGSPPA